LHPVWTLIDVNAGFADLLSIMLFSDSSDVSNGRENA